MYTVLLGGYDALLDQDVAADSESSFLCFTDDATLTSDTWEIVHVEPRFPQDLHRSSRVLKILGHERLEEFDATLCIDASVRLRQRPEEIIAAWLTDDVDMALATHSFREKVVDEFDEVVRLNYDDRARVYEQLVDYALTYPEVLEAQPHWGGMLVRRRTPAVAAAMRLWFDHVLRYSRRDQLSLMLALLHGGVRFRSIEADNFSSEYQEWPVITQRRIAIGKADAHPSGPLAVELRRARRRTAELENRVAELEVEAANAVASREAAAAEADALRATTGESSALAEDAERRLAASERRAEELARAVAAGGSVRGAMSNLRGALARRVRRTG
ncbi:MAG: hypothetical protein ABS63_01765 [Microbacterium sp. SCN 70-27]|uniref:glycosyltransferase domain-containing protein n=1 Tax=unclassified Microbacterium TaxID=2609290 RepID=UPI0008698A65|nr:MULTISPECIES: glycosyltransferase domain-containing protein [unclassified Microbacterium]MBN9225378.1 DUF616 domain-containing protein [Microbacterium sp.]ODT29017.1 MAG: hypothetical protein ABS63_01765 [Microbacterium sp. SCN 70-27]